MRDCMSVREKIENALDKLCYRTTDLNKQTLLDALEHTTSYQTNSVADIPMNRIHTYVSTQRGVTKKAIESRLNRCKKDVILYSPIDTLNNVFGTDEVNELLDMTEHDFIMSVSKYVVSKW